MVSRGFAAAMALLDMSYSKGSSGPCRGKDKQPIKVVASHWWYLQSHLLWLELVCLCTVFCCVHVFVFLLIQLIPDCIGLCKV